MVIKGGFAVEMVESFEDKDTLKLTIDAEIRKTSRRRFLWEGYRNGLYQSSRSIHLSEYAGHK